MLFLFLKMPCSRNGSERRFCVNKELTQEVSSEVTRHLESIGGREFNLNDACAFEARPSHLYPTNRHPKHKIRQQIRVPHDRGYRDFVSGGYYPVQNQG